MKDFRSRKKNTPVLYHSRAAFFIVLAFLILILIFISVSVRNLFEKKSAVDLEQEKIIEKYELLKKERDALQQKVDFLKTKEGIIEEYKKHYNVVESGEEIIKIIKE